MIGELTRAKRRSFVQKSMICVHRLKEREFFDRIGRISKNRCHTKEEGEEKIETEIGLYSQPNLVIT